MVIETKWLDSSVSVADKTRDAKRERKRRWSLHAYVMTVWTQYR